MVLVSWAAGCGELVRNERNPCIKGRVLMGREVVDEWKSRAAVRSCAVSRSASYCVRQISSGSRILRVFPECRKVAA